MNEFFIYVLGVFENDQNVALRIKCIDFTAKDGLGLTPFIMTCIQWTY